MTARSRKTFDVVGGTAPTAGEQPGGQTSRRRAVQAAPAPDLARNSFTWRQSADQQDELEDLQRLVRRALGRRVDKADILAALVSLATGQADVRQQLLKRLEADA
jgi:hypothetical protein